MDQMMGGGEDGMGGQAGFPLETWFWEVSPPEYLLHWQIREPFL